MITSIEELKSALESKKLEVEWMVRSEIGPEWIGGGREVCFYLDDQPLGNSEFHTTLIDLLINKINIPSSGREYIIKGEGELMIINSELIVTYSIVSNIPYDEEFHYEDGKATLLSGI